MASFIQYTTQVRADTWLHNVSSAAIVAASPPYVYSGPGDMPYYAFIPDDAAITAQGWPLRPYRVLVEHQAQGTGEWTGANPTGAIGQSNLLGQKLGFGGTASTTWPTIVVWPQIVTDWTHDGVGALPTVGVRKQRAYWTILEAVIEDIFKRYECDRSRLYLTGVSSGGVSSLGYLLGRAQQPQQFKYDFAAFFGIVTAAASGMRSNPTSNPDTTNFSNNGTSATSWPSLIGAPALARAVVRHGVQCHFWNSTGDGTFTPASYLATWTQMQANAGLVSTSSGSSGATAWTSKLLGNGHRLTEYTAGVGVAPDHNATYNYVYGTDVSGGLLDPSNWRWQEMFAAQFLRRRDHRRAGANVRTA